MVKLNDNYVSLISGVPTLYVVMASAVIVAPGIAVTNGHVLDAADSYSGHTASGKMFTVGVVGRSDRMDLVVLKVPGEVGRPFAWGRPRMAERVWAMGTTNAMHEPVAAGRVVAVDGWACEKLAAASDRRQGPARCDSPVFHGIMYEAEGGPGYSGGPLVNSEGRLLGITQGTYFEVLDDDGRPAEDKPRKMFAYHIIDVLAEARRLIVTQPANLTPEEARPALIYLDRVLAAANLQSASLKR